MSTGQGYAAAAALGVESTWGTGVAVTELLSISSEGIAKTVQQLMSEYLDGNAGQRALINSSKSVLGPLSCEVVFDEISGGIIGVERLIKGFMGASARDAVNSLNQYTISDSAALSYTIAINKQVSVWEAQGVKFNELKISGEAGKKIMLEIGTISKELLKTGDVGIVNAAAAITGITPSLVPTNVTFDMLDFRIGDQANALASGDSLKIESFELTGNNNFSDPQFSSMDANHADSTVTLEPLRNGRRTIDLKVVMPRYEADTVFGWLDNNTALQASLKFSYGSYQFNIFLPNVRMQGNPGAPITGPELMKLNFGITALRNAGTNSYMTLTDSTAITEEIAIECKSARTSAA